MIEYKDDKLGLIKVLNVTEARSNFASVLSDQSAHYIITKNNKPLRVIISFEEYERIKPYLEEGNLPEQIALQGPTEDTFIKGKRESKSRVPGLLHQTMAEDKAIQNGPKPKASSLENTLPERDLLEEKNKEPLSVFDEYELLFDEVLAEKEEKEQSKQDSDQFEDWVEPQDEHEPSVEEDQFYDTASFRLGDVKENIEDDFFTSPPEPEAFDSDDNILLSDNNEQPVEIEKDINSVQNETEVGFEPEYRSPEEEEYFKKYKKLYESFDNNDRYSDPVSPEVASVEKEPVQESALETLLASEEEEDMQQSPLQYSHETEESQFESYEPDSEKPKVELSVEQAPAKKRASSENKKDELPSLKDLLRDLENEKISGEIDEELDDQDIDDLIHRITHD